MGERKEEWKMGRVEMGEEDRSKDGPDTKEQKIRVISACCSIVQ